MNQSKACSNCKQIKVLDEFTVDNRLSSGRAAQCKVCAAQKQLARVNKNREQAREISRNHYAKNRAKRIANSQKWSANNPTRRAEIEAKYRSNHRQETQARSSLWAEVNPDRVKAYKLKRRARINDNGIYQITDKDLRRIYSSPCFYCGSKERIEADHIIPISKGGRHSIGNLISACRVCNASKGTRFVIEFKLAWPRLERTNLWF